MYLLNTFWVVYLSQIFFIDPVTPRVNTGFSQDVLLTRC